MFEEREYHRFFVDTREAESALYTKTKQRLEKTVADRKKGIELLRQIDDLIFETCSTLPNEAKARISAAENGYVTITITELTSFHDVTEVVGVFFQRFKSTYQDTPYVYDMPESRSKEFSCGGNVCVIAKLGPDADCKIVFTGKVRQPYVPEVRAEQKIICPGEPGYDDY